MEVDGAFVEVAAGGREEAKSSEEALSVAKFHACPACLGRGLCQVKDIEQDGFRIYIIYHSGGEPRLVDGVCIWKTGARGHRVPWQPPRGGLEPGGDGFFFNFLLFIFLLFFLR